MADRDVTLDIIARDKTDRATRSAIRNFDDLKRKTDKAVASVGVSLGSTLVETLAPIGAMLAKPMVAGIAAASPAIAAAIISAASLGVGAALIGVGALALKENKKLQKQFEKTTTSIKKGMADAAKPLIGPFLDALKSIEKLFGRLAPHFNAMFRAIAPMVPLMTKAFSGVVEQVVRALSDSMPAVTAAFKGLAQALPTVGKWIGEFIRALLSNPAIIENTTRALALMAAGPLKLLGPLLSGLNVLFGALVNYWRLLEIGGSKLWPMLVAWFDGGSGAVGRLARAWAPLRGAIQNVWQKLKDFAAAKTDKDIEDKFRALIAAIKKVWAPLKTFLGTVFAEAWAFVKRKWNEVVVPWWNNTVKPWLDKEISGALDKAFKKGADKAVGQVDSLAVRVLAHLLTLPARLTGALIGKMASAGHSIGAALINGIIGVLNARKGSVLNIGAAVGAGAAAAARAAFSPTSWAPAQTAAQFTGGASFAAAAGGRTGGPVRVEQTLNVSLDGQPFYSYVDRKVTSSERRSAWRTKVGRR